LSYLAFALVLHLSVWPEEKIRLRAYELYEQRGMIDGRALDDRLQAEGEILERRGQPRNMRRRKPK